MQRRRVLAAWATLACMGHARASGPGFDVQAWDPRHTVPSGAWVDGQGHAWSLPALRGQAVLINFWASWCEPCKEEMPSLQMLADRYPGRLVVLTINLKESAETLDRFVRASGLRLPVVRDVDGSLARAWGVRIYPSTVLVDAGGRVRSVVRGGLDWTAPQGTALVEPLLSAHGPS